MKRVILVHKVSISGVDFYVLFAARVWILQAKWKLGGLFLYLYYWIFISLLLPELKRIDCGVENFTEKYLFNIMLLCSWCRVVSVCFWSGKRFGRNALYQCLNLKMRGLNFLHLCFRFGFLFRFQSCLWK